MIPKQRGVNRLKITNMNCLLHIQFTIIQLKYNNKPLIYTNNHSLNNDTLSCFTKRLHVFPFHLVQLHFFLDSRYCRRGQQQCYIAGMYNVRGPDLARKCVLLANSKTIGN